jgi:hypothetical protein
MAKKEVKTVVDVVNVVKDLTLDQVLDLILNDENPKAVELKDAYSTYDPEKEPVIMKGCKQLVEMGINKEVIVFAVTWNHRKCFLRAKELVTEQATKAGMPLDIYITKVLQPELAKFEAIDKAISAVKYAFNYLKPRPGKEKDIMINVSIEKKVRIISQRKLAELKTSFADDKEALRKAIIENSTEPTTTEIF